MRSNKTSNFHSFSYPLFFIFPAFNNENWPLKPLFFEVPSISSTTFVGRKWLFREVLEHLSSDLPTSGGMIIQGMQASGKSSIILRLVQGSCFGHQGKHRVLSHLETSIHDARGETNRIYKTNFQILRIVNFESQVGISPNSKTLLSDWSIILDGFLRQHN